MTCDAWVALGLSVWLVMTIRGRRRSFRRTRIDKYAGGDTLDGGTNQPEDL